MVVVVTHVLIHIHSRGTRAQKLKKEEVVVAMVHTPGTAPGMATATNKAMDGRKTSQICGQQKEEVVVAMVHAPGTAPGMATATNKAMDGRNTSQICGRLSSATTR
jgi:uncharacterized OB-fold protein